MLARVVKGAVLSTAGVSLAGSNPAVCNSFNSYSFMILKLYKFLYSFKKCHWYGDWCVCSYRNEVICIIYEKRNNI